MAKRKPEITPADIVTFVETQEKRTHDLRERMEDHSEFLRDDWFDNEAMGGVHPENYEKMPTISPGNFKNKLTSELASGLLKRSIPYAGKESKIAKKDISLTEQASYGLTVLGNDRLASLQLPPIQSQVADDIAERGWVAKCVWIYEEKEKGAPKLIVHLEEWDPRNVYWKIGRNGMTAACNVIKCKEDDIKDEYGDDTLEPAEAGTIKKYIWWDKEWQVVAVGGEIVESMYHGLGRVPVYIRPVGPSRLRQSSRHDDTIKFVGEDFAMNGGAIIWPIISRIQSLYLTNIRLGTHPTQGIEFKGGATNLPTFADPKSLWESGALIPLDTDKGHKLVTIPRPPLPAEINQLFQIADEARESATAPGIMSGRSPANITAQGTAMLLHAAMGSLKNGKRAMEDADEWEANELVSQFKAGKFSEVELQGIDGKKKQFDVSVSADKLVTDRKIKSELLLDMPQDQMGKVDVGVKLRDAGAISRQTMQDKFADVPDTEAEDNRIAYERTRELMQLDDFEILDQAIKDKNFMAAQIIFANIQQKLGQAQQMMAASKQSGDISALGRMGEMRDVKMPPNGMVPGMKTEGNNGNTV